MKHVRESLNQYYDYKFFKMFEKDEKANLKKKEQDGLAVIEKIKKNFEDFKKNAKGEILKYKEFWEENKQKKEGFTETGDVYKLFDSDFVVGVLVLPAETLSDGSIDGGMGATDEPEEEIIEGKVLEAEGDGEEDLGLDLDDSPEKDATNDPEQSPDEEMSPIGEPIAGDMPSEETLSFTEPQKYFVVYDISGDEREEIFRCGSNNVVNAFNEFYNDTFKAAMKNIILQYKAKKDKERKEVEKSEKKKIEANKNSKFRKFLGESSIRTNMSRNSAKDFKNMSQEEKDMALIEASRRGHTKAVKSLINAGANIHFSNDRALRWASGNGYVEIVKLLLDAGADVHAYNDEALLWASENGHTEVVKLLKQYMKTNESIESIKKYFDDVIEWMNSPDDEYDTSENEKNDKEPLFQSLNDELYENDYGLDDIREFDLDTDNIVFWNGNVIHPMSGYGGNFDYLNIGVTLIKEAPDKYVVEQKGERRNGKFSREENRQIERGDLTIDEWNIEDFDYDVDYEIDEYKEFATLKDAVEYINSDSCLDYNG